VAVAPLGGTGSAYEAQLTCLSVPAVRCRVVAGLTTRGGRSAGRVVTTVPRGRARVVRIPVKARGQLRLTVRVTDPDGRTRTVYDA
jgi:hypothetical protein